MNVKKMAPVTLIEILFLDVFISKNKKDKRRSFTIEIRHYCKMPHIHHRNNHSHLHKLKRLHRYDQPTLIVRKSLIN